MILRSKLNQKLKIWLSVRSIPVGHYCIWSPHLKYFTRIPSFMFLLGALLGGQAGAVEPLSSEELTSHCAHYQVDPEGKDGIFCMRYIQGFIDGAVATDERVALNVADEFEEEETFSQRATRTRLKSRLGQYGSSYYAEFCLGAPVPLAEVVGLVVGDLGAGNLTGNLKSAREVVYRTLRSHYPCDR